MCAVCLIMSEFCPERLLAAKMDRECCIGCACIGCACLSAVTIGLPHPFMSGARSGDSELRLLIEILEEQHWNKISP